MHFLYYWQKYHSDIGKGLVYKLNQNSTVMQDINPGDQVWAVVLASPDKYALAARFDVKKVGTNPDWHPDYARYGVYFFTAHQNSMNYYHIANQKNIEPLARDLSPTTNGLILGQCFQGVNGVRQLTEHDAERMKTYSETLKLLTV